MEFNLFRILADVSHTLSKIILIWAIHSNSSAEGVSLITQALYATVFCTRYLDIFTAPVNEDWMHIWNFTLKLFYTLSSFYIIFLMTSVYARTREREKAWKFGLYCLVGSMVVAPIWYLIFWKWIYPIRISPLKKILWVFSQILESVCVLPQLVLLRQTTVPTVLDSFYLVALGVYRFLYILNWIVRATKEDRYADPTSWVWGTIQTALIIDFMWVYWTRQRVKLRRGGVVDSEDLRQGWLVGRFVGRKSLDFDYDEEEAQARAEEGQPKNKWGRRGISVSADEGVLDGDSTSRQKRPATRSDPESEPLADPSAFEDGSDDEPAPHTTASESGVRGGDEWNDDLDDDAVEHSNITK